MLLVHLDVQNLHSLLPYSGIETANAILGRKEGDRIIPLSKDEPHVAFGRDILSMGKTFLRFGDEKRAPSLVDFLW